MNIEFKVKVRKLLKNKLCILYKSYRYVRYYKYREKHIKNFKGLHNNETMYIIRPFYQSGFFANFFYVLGHIISSSQKGYQITVDMENYPTLYNEKNSFKGTKNAWEYYFEQPNGLSIDNAYSYKNIILSNNRYMTEYIMSYSYTDNNYINHEMIDKLSPYVDKYIKIQQEILDEVKSIKLNWGENILGLHIRGTDMKNTSNHPIPVSLERYKKEVDEMLDNYEVNKIFCCTDEEEILQYFLNAYKKLIVHTSSLRSLDGLAVHTNKEIVREHHNYLLGKEVLIDALLLSKCDYLICGHSNVAYGAMVFNKNQYEKVVLLESNEYTIT